MRRTFIDGQKEQLARPGGTRKRLRRPVVDATHAGYAPDGAAPTHNALLQRQFGNRNLAGTDAASGPSASRDPALYARRNDGIVQRFDALPPNAPLIHSAPAGKARAQRAFDGTLKGLTKDGFIQGLKQFNKKLKFSEAAPLYKAALEAPTVFKSHVEVARFLYKDNPEVMKEILEFERIAAEKAAEEAEKKRKEERLDALYPPKVVGTYYRGDDRHESKLNDGFKARNPLTLDAARAQAKLWFSAGPADPKTRHEGWIRSKEGGDKVATGNDRECMGYGIKSIVGANTNVYQIKLTGLRVVPVTSAVLGGGLQPNPKQGPQLIMNADTIDAATIIAVGGALAEETSFLTDIPKSTFKMIYENKTADDKAGRGFVPAL